MKKPTQLEALHTLAVTLTAESVDVAARTITGIIAPYGVEGATSIGPVYIDTGAIRLPDDVTRVKLFNGHNREAPIAYLESTDDTADALGPAVFKVAETPAGDLALAEAAGRIRDAFSVELDQLVLTETVDVDAGTYETHVTDSFLRGVGLVSVPAFDDARVSGVAASHTTEGTTPMECSICHATHAADVSCVAHAATLAASAPAPATMPAAAPAGLAANAAPTQITTLDRLYAALTQRHTGRAPAELTAALADITQTANSAVDQPAFVGELWSGVRYQRKIVPLLGSQTLTSFKVNGWRWLVKPEVAPYAGDKTAVPSNAADTEAVEFEADRLAGAHDIDRKFRDFNDTAFFQSYYEALTESYARKSDAAAVTDMLAVATDLVATESGLFGAIAEGVGAIDDETDSASTFVLVNRADLITQLMPMTNFDVPAFLELLGVQIGQIKTHNAMPAGHVLVGTRPAVDFYELPGSPIRVEAIDMTKGGIDAGVFGYYATHVIDANGLVDVEIAA